CWPLSTVSSPRQKEKASPPRRGRPSSRVTRTPASARARAVVVPASPPPTTTVCRAAPGSGACAPSGLVTRFIVRPPPHGRGPGSAVRGRPSQGGTRRRGGGLPAASRRGGRRGAGCGSRAPPDGPAGEGAGVQTGQSAHRDVRLLAAGQGDAAPQDGVRVAFDAVQEAAVDAGHGGHAGP